MTGAQTLAAKLKGSGGSDPEDSKDPWEDAPVPAKVARRIVGGVFHEELPAERIGLATNVMHWGYGSGWGAAYGVLADSLGRSTPRGGLAFGTLVWLSSYAQLVPMGLYEPPWEYEPQELVLDPSYHLVYGSTVAFVYRLL